VSAVFSDDRTYRYSLTRSTGFPNELAVNFVGLNPSTADETRDDPTIRRCVGFARRWGYGVLVMTNLFAYRATRPIDLYSAAKNGDVIGPENDPYLCAEAARAGLVILAWGAGGAWGGRGRKVRAMLREATAGRGIWALSLTLDGEPRHPLYLPRELRPFALAL
jgi:hypothetical protein